MRVIRSSSWLSCVILCLIGFSVAAPPEAHAIPLVRCSSDVSVNLCAGDRDGATVTLTLARMRALQTSNGKVAGQPGYIAYEYEYTSACGGRRPGGVDQLECPRSLLTCSLSNAGPGPLTVVWQRTVSGSPPVTSAWVRLGTTCYPMAGPTPRPALTMAMIQRAFHRMPWARVGVSMQPSHLVTLVRLDTYYQAVWGAAGFEPGEIDSVDPATMFGNRVEIRPRLVSATYVFGDGTAYGPTTDTGGVYPTGTVKHQYPRPGSYAVRVDVVMGADFRVNGHGWAPIPDTVTLTGIPSTLSVRSARAVLIR